MFIRGWRLFEVAFIRGRRLFEDGVYLRAAFNNIFALFEGGIYSSNYDIYICD